VSDMSDKPLGAVWADKQTAVPAQPADHQWGWPPSDDCASVLEWLIIQLLAPSS
jgi:hypothetical protein